MKNNNLIKYTTKEKIKMLSAMSFILFILTMGFWFISLLFLDIIKGEEQVTTSPFLLLLLLTLPMLMLMTVTMNKLTVGKISTIAQERAGILAAKAFIVFIIISLGFNW